MSRAFADICFTDSVRAAQNRYGSRDGNLGFETAADPRAELGETEQAFVAERDGFYQASVGETGWPYVQFRGGRPGFLKVLDPRTLVYADVRGNRQYISVGNLDADGRVALILMDYAARRRLKIWGVAHIVELGTADWPTALPAEAGVERAIVIDVKAYDWNCPKHITPRFTEAQIQQRVAGLLAEIEGLQAENRRLREGLAARDRS
ncbi:pyridoxamine 5'-phosphate oxidase family protein [Methylomonas sp. UP202]|uniref:pyridoxamine 5'-phosphate oxidase family protein n=1 Tax=Methylomonas sp. UP202 TaxID=3040943 RepID=UPI0024789A57|nr:pyridoxamine 5'-phosphate oxidase family protein [Methylomonas sp. UP202]WGS87352.1 pyridoxamine 5'-phosphate oxidase family protein [Methylomonas sp. UP202]